MRWGASVFPMRISFRVTLLGILLVLVACVAQSSAAEPPTGAPKAKTPDYYRKKLESITIPWLTWNANPGAAFDDWQRIVRENDPSGKGIPLVLSPSTIRDLDPKSDGPASKLRFAENARNVTAGELLSYICKSLEQKFRLSRRGVIITAPGKLENLETSREPLRKTTKTFAFSSETLAWLKTLNSEGDVRRKQNGPSAKAVRDMLVRGTKLDSHTVKVSWLRAKDRIQVTASEEAMPSITECMEQVEDRFGPARIPEPLNAGEERMVADFDSLKNLKLASVSIDAPTLQEAVDKLREVIRATPGAANAKMEWIIQDQTLANAGPVHFSETEIPAVVALFVMMDSFAVTVRGNPDGSWQFVPRRLRDAQSPRMFQFRIPAAFFERSKEEKPGTANSENPSSSGGITIPKWTFAMYSPTSDTLVAKNTVIGELAMRKAVRELWIKHSGKK